MDHVQLVGMDDVQFVNLDDVPGPEGVDDDEGGNDFDGHDHGFTFMEKGDGTKVEDDEDDPVVAEYPVFLNHDLADQLHLIQSGGESDRYGGIRDLDVLEVKYKPFSSKLQFTIDTRHDPDFYDEEKGINLVRVEAKKPENDDDIEIDDETDDKEPKLGRHILETNEVHTIQGEHNYGIGMFTGNAFYVTPLKTISKLATTLPYMDKQDSANAAGGDGNLSAADASESDDEKIQVTFSHEEFSAASTAARLSTHHSLFRVQNEMAPWHNLSFDYFNLEKWSELQTNNKEEEEEEKSGVKLEHDDDVSKAEYAKALIADAGKEVNGPLPDQDSDDDDDDEGSGPEIEEVAQ